MEYQLEIYRNNKMWHWKIRHIRSNNIIENGVEKLYLEAAQEAYKKLAQKSMTKFIYLS